MACHLAGFCPTSKERESNEIEKMANNLKGLSDKETLTNVLEWQDRNIAFWIERYPIPNILLYIFLIFFVILIIGLITSPFLLIMLNIQLFPWFVYTWLKIFLSSIATTIAITIFIIHSRKIPLKELYNAFRSSVPINTLLENKLGVCRDYAKLTACLLSKIYPDKEIYFAHAPSHVATGIMIENKLYMLDQHLPVLTIDQWHKREHSNKSVHKLKDNQLESVNIDSLLSKTNITKLKLEELAMEMSKLLNISKERKGDKEGSSLKLPRWKKGAILYSMNDEIVNYSLVRALKKKISAELIELNRITKLEIQEKNDNLEFQISFK